jgi:hypothetical protein
VAPGFAGACLLKLKAFPAETDSAWFGRGCRAHSSDPKHSKTICDGRSARFPFVNFRQFVSCLQLGSVKSMERRSGHQADFKRTFEPARCSQLRSTGEVQCINDVSTCIYDI